MDVVPPRPKGTGQSEPPVQEVEESSRAPYWEEGSVPLHIQDGEEPFWGLSSEYYDDEELGFGTDAFGAPAENPPRAIPGGRLQSEQQKEVSSPAERFVEPASPVAHGVRHALGGRVGEWSAGHHFREQTARRVKAERRVELVRALVAGSQKFAEALGSRRTMGALASVFLLVLLGIGAWSLIDRGLRMKSEVLGVSTAGVDHLQSAVANLKQKDFAGSQANFESAAQSFSDASSQINEWNGTLVDMSRFIPGASKLASGKYAVEAGQHFAVAGQTLNSAVSQLASLHGGIAGLPLLTTFQTIQKATATSLGELTQARDALDKVNIDDLPTDKRDKFIQIKEGLPLAIESMQLFVDHSAVLADLFGGNGPRKYLFLLQNNQEARATGGFIGTYALLDISDGRVRNFFVDGVFNPDGQLTQNVVPPIPLQKVSGAWSLHDSNWFPDFPVSAEKAIGFYEKTGGPTVDGVITLTPVVIQKLLAATGPITLDQYGMTLDADNFMALVQDQVEFKYDKTENKPKQILADLVPALLDRLLTVRDPEQIKTVTTALESSFNEKHILLYSRDDTAENLIKASGWSGEILPSTKDYLSVINTNINGYKTDGVVDQTVEHQATISEDGTVTDTVIITRHHTGGNTPYDFWNKVNADYMRVYVPEGAQLLSAEGETRETVTPPLDYAALKFTRDPDVVAEESGETIDPATGTTIYTQSGKTVFANWVYVSPGETATVKYAYRLPFRVEPPDTSGVVAGSYSVIFQKQSGSVGGKLLSRVSYPDRFKSLWQTGDAVVSSGAGAELDSDLQNDRFYGIVLGY